MSDIIASDVQGHYVDSALVTLFELELEGTYVFFHAGLDELLDEVQFVSIDGTAINTYTPLPMMIDGMEIQADGAQSRPTVTMANVASVFKDSLGNLTNDDLIGKSLIRRQTFQKFLVGGSSESTVGTPPTEFPIREYIIDRIASETNVLVSFELASPFDLEGITLPRRTIIGKYCSWAYQGYYADPSYGGCTWRLDGKYEYANSTNDNSLLHSFYFTEDDNPIVLFRDPEIYPEWSSATTYDNEAIVVDSLGLTWQSLFSQNTDNTPAEGSDWWNRVYRYKNYDAITLYAKGDYVRYGTSGRETIFKCLIGNTGQAPGNRSRYWTRADICGKSLTSCKSRFQAVPADLDIVDYGPAGTRNTSHTLPFGAFPGSAKYR